jgi:BA14K-like protein
MRALCCVLLTVLSGTAFAQTTGAINPSAAAAKPALSQPGSSATRRAELAPGCTHFRSYDPVSGTYMVYGGRRRQCTAAATPVPKTKPIDNERLDPVETVARNNADKPPSPPEGDADLLVAILMARPEINSISDLASKSVAIDDKYSASNGNVRVAIVAAGAPDVQLRENQTPAIDRLVSGDASAAVLALVSARAADGFPEISGYKIFHIPLSPRSLESLR